MITVEGKLVTVSEDENSDLLYAIRGAGQYFGLVTSLIVRTYPVTEILGNMEGCFWSGRFVFPTEKTNEVSKAMQHVVNNSSNCTGGLMMVAAPPPAQNPVVVVTARLIGSDSGELQAVAFKPLYDLQPLVTGGGQVKIENNGDATMPLCVQGDLKKLRLTGIHNYDPESLPEIVKLWQDLVTSCPDAARSMFSIQWESQPPARSSIDSANSMRNVRFWANNLTWYTNAADSDTVQGYLEKVVAVTRKGREPDEYFDFPNSLREPESPIERRYKSEERLGRLRKLKNHWDPQGIFGKELL